MIVPFSAQRLARIGTVIGFCLSFCGQAQATAFAGVDFAYWQVVPWQYYNLDTGEVFPGLPPGFVVSCLGASDAVDENICVGSASLSVTNSSASDVIRSIHRDGSVQITNNTDQEFSGVLSVLVDFSAFNPGGPSVGAKIDIPGVEYARFFSQVSGYGNGFGDAHSCDTNGYVLNVEYTTPTECGVGLPDSSEIEIDFGSFAPHASVTLPYAIDITVEAIGAPEPGTLQLFWAGLAGLAFIGCLRLRYRASS